MKTTMLLTVTLLAFGFVPTAVAADNCFPHFAFCPAAEGLAGTFADCTKAPCTWKEGASTMSCKCLAKSNAASTTQAPPLGEGCKAGTSSNLQSRYSLVDSMGVCTSATNRWGFCLDIKCGPADSSGYSYCDCTAVTSSGYSSNQYVIVKGNSGFCAANQYYSSATPSQVFAATAFLRCKQPNTGVVDPTIVWVAP